MDRRELVVNSSWVTGLFFRARAFCSTPSPPRVRDSRFRTQLCDTSLQELRSIDPPARPKGRLNRRPGGAPPKAHLPNSAAEEEKERAPGRVRSPASSERNKRRLTALASKASIALISFDGSTVTGLNSRTAFSSSSTMAWFLRTLR